MSEGILYVIVNGTLVLDGGTIVEGYPVIPKKEEMPGVFAFTGLYPAFVKAGFKEVARRSETRVVMRRRLRPPRSD